jgi:transcriptional regulator with XRE-family HTH domain
MRGIELRRIRRAMRLTRAQLADRLRVQRMPGARLEIGRRKIPELVA